MKVILNQDLHPLGEEGDVKDVAKGYARNYLFPRGIALPYNESTIKLFEGRREEIEGRKAEKRRDAAGIKEKLEGLELLITMPAGPNGKLYGAVTSQTIADELAKQGFPLERKRIEVPGNSFKSVGKYKVTVKLYENAGAEVSVSIEGQAVKEETKAAPARKDRRARHEAPAAPSAADAETPSEADAETAVSQTAAPELSSAEAVPGETDSREDVPGEE